ncbi:MAG: metallophosphoesterase [Eubacteriales bacterium]|nr:metallophosphoesterase [Eubacteriales bacterium]
MNAKKGGGEGMWLLLFGGAILLALAGLGYLVVCFHRFSFLTKLGAAHPALSWLCALLPVAALCLLARFNVPTLVVVLLHLPIAFLLCGALALLFEKLTGRAVPYDLRGLCALLLTAVYLTVGWFNAHRVSETDYALRTGKAVEPLRLALIADSHLGVTLDGEGFARELERIQAARPDLVVIAGDFVDDDSSRADLMRACEALGTLETRCGVYYVYGNHDRGYFDSRDFSAGELRRALEENGVTILEDACVPIGEGYTLIGRRDRSNAERMDMEELTAGLDAGRYWIVLDHQPNDYAAEAAAGADLVLSGHTHGGHMFPAGQLGLLMHANDFNYGLTTRGNTSFIVTSGVSGWAIPFKTGTRSEFVVIDIAPSAAE